MNKMSFFIEKTYTSVMSVFFTFTHKIQRLKRIRRQFFFSLFTITQCSTLIMPTHVHICGSHTFVKESMTQILCPKTVLLPQKTLKNIKLHQSKQYSTCNARKLGYLAAYFEQLFQHFKYGYIHFHTFFYSHVYQKYSNNIT